MLHAICFLGAAGAEEHCRRRGHLLQRVRVTFGGARLASERVGGRYECHTCTWQGMARARDSRTSAVAHAAARTIELVICEQYSRSIYLM